MVACLPCPIVSGPVGLLLTNSTFTFIPFPRFEPPYCVSSDNTRSMTINTKTSALLLPYKTFCGDITLKKYKGNKKKYKAALTKCQKKNVTFTFEITNTDGTAFRYNYTVPAGSKFFK